MCEYVERNRLIEPKEVFKKWIKKVQDYIRDNYDITFSYLPIGSGSRNMVIKKCNDDYFDLDYQIVMQSIPSNYNWNSDCKRFKDIFRSTFNKFRPNGFSDCKDSVQALRTKNKNAGYGFDFIITCYDDNDNFYIIYNKKNTNNANNNDYEWAIRRDMNKYHERLRLIKDAKMWNYLRAIYKDKRHKHKDDQEPNKKKSYQLLNEAVVETLDHFKIRYPKNKK